MKSLRCLFGRHAPSPKPVSNAGYRFSRCRRCGVDIVQSIFTDWREPTKGFRVVWRAPEPVRAAPRPAPALPPRAALTPPLPQAPRPKPSPPPSADFMRDDGNGFDWMRDLGEVKRTEAAGKKDGTRADEAALWTRRLPLP